MAFQMTGVLIVCSTVCSGPDQRKHQSSASVRGIHWWPVNSPHKLQATQKGLPFDDVIIVDLLLNGSIITMKLWNPSTFYCSAWTCCTNHNAPVPYPTMPQFVTFICTCTHFCYKTMYCGIFVWCIVEFVRWVFRSITIANMWIIYAVHPVQEICTRFALYCIVLWVR